VVSVVKEENMLSKGESEVCIVERKLRVVQVEMR
jgi:hypothetical protein